ncbi:MAG: hypothetical protein ACLFU9_07365, partial [Candidatus Bathyarchaeia archaeon]
MMIVAPNVTISTSDDLDKRMKAIPEVNWSEVCRQAIKEYVERRNQQEKGELVENLRNYLSTIPLKEEDKERLRDEETRRFSQRWGPPQHK